MGGFCLWNWLLMYGFLHMYVVMHLINSWRLLRNLLLHMVMARYGHIMQRARRVGGEVSYWHAWCRFWEALVTVGGTRITVIDKCPQGATIKTLQKLSSPEHKLAHQYPIKPDRVPFGSLRWYSWPALGLRSPEAQISELPAAT